MEKSFRILKFWRNVVADEDDSFFDLVFKSPAVDGGREGLNKDFQFIESSTPRDVFQSKNDIAISKPESPAVNLKHSTPNFKVLFGFKKSSNYEKAEDRAELKTSPVNRSSRSRKAGESNRFSVKCGVEEMRISNDLARDCSLRSRFDEENSVHETLSAVSSEKSVRIFMKLIKPLYNKDSKKAKLTNFMTPASSPVAAPVNVLSRNFSEGSRKGGSKIGAMNLWTSRSASVSGVVIGVSPPSVHRRDDSLLEQHDRIQGAILHCKKILQFFIQRIISVRPFVIRGAMSWGACVKCWKASAIK